MDYCKTCGMRSENSCLLHKISVNPDEDFCSWHREELNFCKYCKNIIARGGLFTKTGIVCGQCAQVIGTCQTCKHAKAPCAFDAYNGPEDKYIQVTRKQGNAIFTTTDRNPEIVKKVCSMCHCYLNETCLRGRGQCSFYSEY